MRAAFEKVVKICQHRRVGKPTREQVQLRALQHRPQLVLLEGCDVGKSTSFRIKLYEGLEQKMS